MKSGFVAVAGRPNVGKSTLVNALAGGKVAIVSDKPQTTRRRISGVVNGDGYQLVLVDLPGFQRPLDPMTERMQRTVDQAFEDVDAVLFVLSTRERIGAGDRFIAQAGLLARRAGRDRAEQGRPPQARARRDPDGHGVQARRLPRAAPGEREDGRRRRRAARGARRAVCPRGPRTSRPSSEAISPPEEEIGELIREKALALTREEVPHAISVEVEEVDEKVVRASLYVETDSQKQIVVGKGGSVVKEIGVRARPEIEHLLGHPVFLELKVKVKPKWRRDEGLLERLGI